MGGEACALGGEARHVSEPPAARGGWDEGPRGGGRLGARAQGVGFERLGDEGEPERECEREGNGKVSAVIPVGLQEQDPPGGAGVACGGKTGRAGPPSALPFASGGDELGRLEPEGDVGDSLLRDSCSHPRPVWLLDTRWA